MLRPYTYGTVYELKARDKHKGEIFLYEFEVFQRSIFLTTFGEPLQAVKRIQFTRDFKEGHFNILISWAKATNPNNLQLTNPDIQQSPTTSEPMEFTLVEFVLHCGSDQPHSVH